MAILVAAATSGSSIDWICRGNNISSPLFNINYNHNKHSSNSGSHLRAFKPLELTSMRGCLLLKTIGPPPLIII
jgi:hypothetical protein